MFVTCNLPDAAAVGDNQPREDAYGPSRIASSTRTTKQIDLWMDVVAAQGCAVRYEMVTMHAAGSRPLKNRLSFAFLQEALLGKGIALVRER
jgi:hypothetical protein